MREMYTTACAACAAKLNLIYYMDAVENSEREGGCPWCFQPARVRQYEYSRRQRRYSPPRRGGGERNRAGGR